MWFDNLTSMKKASDKTIEQVSKESGVPLGTLNKLFAGQTKDPKLSTIYPVVQALGFSLDELVDSNPGKPQRLSKTIHAIVSTVEQLNEEGQSKVLIYAKDLVDTGKHRPISGAKEDPAKVS